MNSKTNPINFGGLVQMDRTTKMQQELKIKKQLKNPVIKNPRLWRSDWKK